MRRVIGLFLLFISVASAQAEIISSSRALQVASAWHHRLPLSSPEMSGQAVLRTVVDANGQPVLYAAGFPSGGYVLIAADDRVHPILGYSSAGHLRDSSMPPAWNYLLHEYAMYINSMRVRDGAPDISVRQSWADLTPESGQTMSGPSSVRLEAARGVEPLLSTTWGQGTPYNGLCPPEVGGPGGRTVTGCVATAMAQIMRYYRYPSRPAGTYSYRHPIHGEIVDDFSSHSYDWDNMPGAINSLSPAAQRAAVSQLMFDCGVMVAMDYGTDGSSAAVTSLPASLFHFMQYAYPTYISSTMTPLEIASFTITTEIQNGRPVYFSGRDTASLARHAFVCDGYDDGGLFHCNFGWDGAGDGYFRLTGLSANLEFRMEYDAIVGITPSQSVCIRSDATWSGEIAINQRVAVDDNVCLTIAPGTRITFGKMGGLTVFGSLRAIGNPENHITLTAADTLEGWNGIEFSRALAIFRNTRQDSSLLRFCEITYAKAAYWSVTSMCGVAEKATSSIQATRYDMLGISDCRFSHNTGSNIGAAISAFASSIVIERSIIEHNRANAGAAISLNRGGATRIIGNDISANGGEDVTRSIFGAVACVGSGTNPIIQNNIFRNNWGRDGSAIHSFYDASPSVTGNVFYGNKGTSEVFQEDGALTFINNTMCSDSITGLYVTGAGRARVTSSILRGNRAYQVVAGGNTIVSMEYCNVQDGTTRIWGKPGNISVLGVFADDPLFASGASFTLTNASPCVNRGDPFSGMYGLPPLDLHGYPRVAGGRVDIGATENQSVPAPAGVFCKPSAFDANIASRDTIEILLACINNPTLEGIAHKNAALTVVLAGDTTRLRLWVNTGAEGEYVDTVRIAYGSDTLRIPIALRVGVVVRGLVSGIWSSSQVTVAGHVTIPKGSTLSISPGTTVTFAGHYKLDVKGRLLAIGDSARPIRFAPANTTIGWKGIRFEGTEASEDSSRIEYCILEDGKNRGETLDINGGALFVSGFSKLVVSHCVIRNNDALGYAGGGIYLEDGANIAIRDCEISGNKAYDGGGISVRYSSPTIVRNLISGNSGGGGYAGGIEFKGTGNGVVSCNVIVKNKAGLGGAVSMWNKATPLLANNTIAKNIGICGGALFSDYQARPRLVNNILFGDSSQYGGKEVTLSSFGDLDCENNIISGGISGFGFYAEPYALTGEYRDNIDEDPQFIGQGTHPFSVKIGSPCRNKGKAGFTVGEALSEWDIRLTPRILEGRIDIGAYECDPLTDNKQTGESLLPSWFVLLENYPNPFNPSTTIRYGLPGRSHVVLIVYNTLGQQITTLVEGERDAGYHEVRFDGANFPSGVYFYRMQAGSYVETKKLLMIR
jgi:parallel beta-helix repeat protein